MIRTRIRISYFQVLILLKPVVFSAAHQNLQDYLPILRTFISRTWVSCENTCNLFFLSFYFPISQQVNLDINPCNYCVFIYFSYLIKLCQWPPLQVALVKYSWCLLLEESLLSFQPQILTTFIQEIFNKNRMPGCAHKYNC